MPLADHSTRLACRFTQKQKRRTAGAHADQKELYKEYTERVPCGCPLSALFIQCQCERVKRTVVEICESDDDGECRDPRPEKAARAHAPDAAPAKCNEDITFALKDLEQAALDAFFEWATSADALSLCSSISDDAEAELPHLRELVLEFADVVDQLDAPPVAEDAISPDSKRLLEEAVQWLGKPAECLSLDVLDGSAVC